MFALFFVIVSLPGRGKGVILTEQGRRGRRLERRGRGGRPCSSTQEKGGEKENRKSMVSYGSLPVVTGVG